MNPLSVFALCLLLTACGGKKQSGVQDDVKTAEEPSKYIPFINMLRDDLRYIDSTPLMLNKYVKNGGGPELESVAGREEIKQLAAVFMEPDFNQESARKDYTETTYADKTTNTVTFNYLPRAQNNPVKKIFLNFSSNHTGEFSLRWASLHREHGDTLVNLYWKKGSYFLVGKSWPGASGQRTEVSTRVVWNESYKPGQDDVPATTAPLTEQKADAKK